MVALLERLLQQLDEGRAVALATLIERRGSLPMGRDARMAIFADGSLAGTIGGGCLEAEVYATAQRLLAAGSGRSVDTYHLSEVEEGLGGHVCGGSVRILTRVLEPDARTVAVIQSACALCAEGRSGLLLSLLDGPADAPREALACDGDGTIDGRARRPRHGAFEVTSADGRARYVADRVSPPPLLLLFGAGHCGRAIGAAAHRAGFAVRLFDDRQPFLQGPDLEWAEHCQCVDFDDLSEILQAGANTYVVIVTRGHEHDLAVLRQTIGHPFRYLGMIGSRRKRVLFERELEEEGVSAAALAVLRSPMGLDIGADTPEEIAVAVVAEMIAARRSQGSTRTTRLRAAYARE